MLAGSGVFWGLNVFARPQAMPDGLRMPAMAAVGQGPLGRVLGVPAVAEEDEAEEPDPGDGRFVLLGVVAPPSARAAQREGVALIAVNGQPARPWRVGKVVDGDLVLLAVSKRGAELGPKGGEPTVSLTLPEPTGAGTAAAPAAHSANATRPLPGHRPGLLGGVNGVPMNPAQAGRPAQAAPPQPEEEDDEE